MSRKLGAGHPVALASPVKHAIVHLRLSLRIGRRRRQDEDPYPRVLRQHLEVIRGCGRRDPRTKQLFTYQFGTDVTASPGRSLLNHLWDSDTRTPEPRPTVCINHCRVIHTSGAPPSQNPQRAAVRHLSQQLRSPSLDLMRSVFSSANAGLIFAARVSGRSVGVGLKACIPRTWPGVSFCSRAPFRLGSHFKWSFALGADGSYGWALVHGVPKYLNN